MKKERSRNIVTTLSLTAIMLAVITVPAIAYDIDGNLDDWGINLSEDWSVEGTWVPSSSTADWIVEDNRDPCYSRWKNSYTGVHIEGHGAAYDTYLEPKLEGGRVQPSGGEPYDIEAFYFDSDYTNAYFAIVTSVPQRTMGDLAIDLDRDDVYEYGIALSEHDGLSVGRVYNVLDWTDPSHFPSSAPYRIENTADDGVGSGSVAYINIYIPDHGQPNYVIEISAPRTALGSPSEGDISKLHTTLLCGNDVIEIAQVTWTEIPEFSTVAIPVGITFCLFYFYRRKRQGRKE